MYEAQTMCHNDIMFAATDRWVLVPAGQFDDLLELTRLAVERLPQSDPLTSALAGAVAEIRTSAHNEAS